MTELEAFKSAINLSEYAASCGIIDFVQHRQGCTLGKVRQALRPWIGRVGERPPRPQPGLFAHEIETISEDWAILMAYSRMRYPREILQSN